VIGYIMNRCQTEYGTISCTPLFAALRA